MGGPPWSHRASVRGAHQHHFSASLDQSCTILIVNTVVNYQGEDSELDQLFGALANRHRRQIVHLLALQPAAIQQVARHVGLSLPAIHRHLVVLEEAQLIRRKKAGRTNFLAIDRSGLRKVQEWAEGYHPGWGTDAETLENYVAGIARDAQP